MSSMNASEFVEVLSQDQPPTPLGRLSGAGYIHRKTGMLPWRVLGCYAVVYVLEGRGRYQDRNGAVQDVEAGDLLLLFPELPHRYGPGRRETWSEFHIVFEGPAFDFWRDTGTLAPHPPVCRLRPVAEWRERLVACTAGGDGRVQVSRLLTSLTEATAARRSGEGQDALLPWLDRARHLLERDLNSDVTAAEVAAQIGLSYETFRKVFEQQVGVSPARYRAGKRMDAARSLLLHTPMTSRQIADSLGFRDEFYFSKRFKQAVGVSPREFRKETQLREVA